MSLVEELRSQIPHAARRCPKLREFLGDHKVFPPLAKEQSFSFACLLQYWGGGGGREICCFFPVKRVTKMLFTAAPQKVSSTQVLGCARSVLGRRDHTKRNDGNWGEIKLKMKK